MSAETADGQIVCNPTFHQVPGHPDDFVGRGLGIGTLDCCHTALKGEVGFLAVFKMDWQRHKLILHHKLLTPPLKTPSGVNLHGAIDPYVADYNGQFWLALECTVPGAVSACMVPLANDLGKVDVEIASIGGTAGPEVCRSGHDNSPGCWRMSLSEADAPLGRNVFGEHVLAASSFLPGNMASYPRVIVDHAGKHYLFGVFGQQKSAPPKDRAKPLPENGLFYFPFEPREAVKR